MTAIVRFKTILTLWLLSRVILLLNRVSPLPGIERSDGTKAESPTAKPVVRARYGHLTLLNFERRGSSPGDAADDA
ncbi:MULTISPECIES: hypothetical protein [Rhizobium]|uniref:Uncharacterized protein n=1 Tax=Rhizobium tropici TaxID=398 RepID=A0A6P1CFJ2_RHITR|nr:MULTISPECIES: hypothetical protein [Rhizobium]AGB71748.1 hypothetical protein RTCIAT899_CH11835 [Rhizobium tropici CIAT 899]MBB4245125.1 hypothetical protein [Rhizobium tropici]MBB5596488.1 hypothetical protein [Rhizobium tropici]MBB6495421.1 hypothetical protein [Rhizobium tropici]NEV14533.1 hypothetical protein [Rhizobium tropici]